MVTGLPSFRHYNIPPYTYLAITHSLPVAILNRSIKNYGKRNILPIGIDTLPELRKCRHQETDTPLRQCDGDV